LHAVIKEVSEAEERNTSLDDVGAQAAGSSEDLDGDGAGITFIARKASSKWIVLLRVESIGGYIIWRRVVS
jgi:hypothetical protein